MARVKTRSTAVKSKSVGLADAAGGIQVKNIWPDVSSTANYAKTIQLDWNKVFKQIATKDRKFAAEQAAALSASLAGTENMAQRTARLNNALINGATSVGGTQDSSTPITQRSTKGMSAIFANLQEGAIQDLVRATPKGQKSKGTGYWGLTPENAELFERMKQSEWDLEEMGKKPHKSHTSILDRVMDVLSRGGYATANTTKRGFEEFAYGGKDFSKGAKGGDISDTLTEMGKGFWKGLSGQEKTTFAEVEQDIADTIHAKNRGETDARKIKHGEGHINPILKFTTGLAADIFMDPTTYLGVGALAHVVEGGKGIRGIAKFGGIKESRDAIAQTREIHKHLDKLLDLDLDAVGYKTLDDGSGVVGKLAKDKDIRRQQVTNWFLGARNKDGTPVAREAIAAQLKEAENYLAYASKAAIRENNTAAKAALDIVGSSEFLQKSAANMYKSVEATVAADLLKDMANEGKKFVDVPVVENVPAKVTLNPTKLKARKAEVAKEISKIKARITKLKKGTVKHKGSTSAKAGKVEIHPTDKIRLNGIKNSIKKYKKDVELNGGKHVPLGIYFSDRQVDVIREALGHSNNMAIAAGKFNPDEVVPAVEKLFTKMSDDIPEVKGFENADEEIKALTDRRYDLENEIYQAETHGVPIGDKAPDERIFDVQWQKANHAEAQAATAHNLALQKELESRLASIRPHAVDEAQATLLEIALRNIDPNVQRVIQVRFGGMFGSGGAVLATFRAPDIMRRASQAYATVGFDKNALNFYNKFMIGFDKAFRASGTLDPFINAERLRTAGRAEELKNLHVKDLRNRWGKVKKADRHAIYRAWRTGAPPEGMGPEVADLLNDFDRELEDLGKFIDGSMEEVLGKTDWTHLNRWLPKKRVQLVPVKDPSLPVGSPEWWHLALRESNATDIAEVQFQLRIAKEKMIGRADLVKSIESTLGVPIKGAAGDATFSNILKGNHGYKPVKGFDENVVFSPDMQRDLTRLLELVDDQAKHGDILRGFDRALNLWKGAVTVYNPAFHVRNAGGDMFVSYLNGMFVGKHGMIRAMKSHRAAIKTMKSVKWEKMDPAMRIAIMEGQHEATGIGQVVLRLHGPGFTGIGKDLTAEQVWGMYLKYGLKQSFTASEFGKILSGTRGVRAGTSVINDAVRGLSEGREDWFRLAHFIDVLQREALHERSFERAAANAAAQIRKFHFDYTDFTPFERSVLVRAIPFYKWTRKSLPLMAEMLFAKPGAISVYPKTMSNLSQMTGFEVGADPLFPNSDAVIPDWIRNRGAVPLYTHNGNTVFFDPSNPFNDSIRTWQGNTPTEALTGKSEVEALLGMSNPLFRVPVEMATGHQFFGNRDIVDKTDYLAQQSPQSAFITNLINGNNSQGPVNDRLSSPESLNKVFGGGTIENTPERQKGELQRLIDILNQQRKSTRKELGWAEPR